MTRRVWVQIAIHILMATSIAGCCCPCVTFRKLEASDLVGTWRADYDEDYFDRGCWYTVTGVETLTLRPDGTFRQVYDDGRGYVYTSPWNNWYLEDRRAGPVLHLERGRFYALGIEFAEALADGSSHFHSDDDGRGQPVDLDGSEVILQVTKASLDYPPVCDLDAPVIVTFYLVGMPAPTSTLLP